MVLSCKNYILYSNLYLPSAWNSVSKMEQYDLQSGTVGGILADNHIQRA